MTTRKLILLVFITQLFFKTSLNSQNQNEPNQELEATIKHHDSIFWKGFNACDLETMKNYVSDDLEFYHDKNGLSLGAETFIKTTEKNLCSNKSNWQLRREVIEGTIKIYPIKNYGAIISGEHQFYITENKKPEYLDGIAKFTHVWHLKNNEWKMTRVLSYDHKAPPQNTDKKEILLSNNTLNTFIGEYEAPNTGTIIISKIDKTLKIKTKDMVAIVYPQTKSLFFHKEMPLTFEFIENNKGEIFKMIVREQGKIVEEAIKK